MLVLDYCFLEPIWPRSVRQFAVHQVEQYHPDGPNDPGDPVTPPYIIADSPHGQMPCGYPAAA